jgi:hypothetical protein
MPAERHDTALDGDADLRRIDHGCESQRRQHVSAHGDVVHLPPPRFKVSGVQTASQSSAIVTTEAVAAKPSACRLPIVR